MAVVAILDDCFTGGDALAKLVAKQLGYCVADDNVVVEGAAALGTTSQDELREVLEIPFTFLNGVTHGRHTRLALIQAALANEIRADNVVCCGCAALLLAPLVREVLFVRIVAPLDVRVRFAQARLRIGTSEAIAYIRKRDRAKEKWVRSLHGVTGVGPAPCDATINLGDHHTSMEEASAVITGLVKQRSESPCTSTARPARNDWALATLVKTQLALDSSTRNLDLDVAANCGHVTVKGSISDPHQIHDIERVTAQVPDVAHLNLDNIDIRCPKFGPAPHVVLSGQDDGPRRKLWPAWLMVTAILCLTIAVSSVMNKGISTVARFVAPSTGLHVRMFAGVITDTKCGPNHKFTGQDSESQCVRACVRADRQAKYALYDGNNVYVLADQRTPAMFAARRVLVAGVLDEKTKTLAVRSIDLVL